MKITYKQILSLKPCYHPRKIGMPEDYEATIPEFIKEYRGKVKKKTDIQWILCHRDFMSEKELRLFAVWCARQVQHLTPLSKGVSVLDIIDKYMNGYVTKKELKSASAIISDAFYLANNDTSSFAVQAVSFVYSAVYFHCFVDTIDEVVYAAYFATIYSSYDSGYDSETESTQVDKLLEIFEGKENESI